MSGAIEGDLVISDRSALFARFLVVNVTNYVSNGLICILPDVEIPPAAIANGQRRQVPKVGVRHCGKESTSCAGAFKNKTQTKYKKPSQTGQSSDLAPPTTGGHRLWQEPRSLGPQSTHQTLEGVPLRR